MRFHRVLEAADLVVSLPDFLIALLDHLAGVAVEPRGDLSSALSSVVREEAAG